MKLSGLRVDWDWRPKSSKRSEKKTIGVHDEPTKLGVFGAIEPLETIDSEDVRSENPIGSLLGC